MWVTDIEIRISATIVKCHMSLLQCSTCHAPIKIAPRVLSSGGREGVVPDEPVGSPEAEILLDELDIVDGGGIYGVENRDL